MKNYLRPSLLPSLNSIEAPPVTVFDGTPKQAVLLSNKSTPKSSMDSKLAEITPIKMEPDYKIISEESQILYS